MECATTKEHSRAVLDKLGFSSVMESEMHGDVGPEFVESLGNLPQLNKHLFIMAVQDKNNLLTGLGLGNNKWWNIIEVDDVMFAATYSQLKTFLIEGSGNMKVTEEKFTQMAPPFMINNQGNMKQRAERIETMMRETFNNNDALIGFLNSKDFVVVEKGPRFQKDFRFLRVENPAIQVHVVTNDAGQNEVEFVQTNNYSGEKKKIRDEGTIVTFTTKGA
jgi:hypothetical protein